jgi:hypothetical protein
MSNATHSLSPAMLERQQELEALKDTPEGLLEIARIFRRVVMLPGDHFPPGVRLDDMISDIVDIELRVVEMEHARKVFCVPPPTRRPRFRRVFASVYAALLSAAAIFALWLLFIDRSF